MNHRKPSPEQEAYFASIAHLEYYFDLKRVRSFRLEATTAAKVDAFLSLHAIPDAIRTDIHWIFGYISIQYTEDFERDKTKWAEEREFYRKPDTRHGIELYQHMQLPNWEHIHSISIKVKDGTSINGIQEQTVKISYPPMLRFIIEAIQDKRYSEHDIENKGHFFSDEAYQLEKYTEYEKWGSPDYLTIRRKETIEELYYYLFHNTRLGTQALCRFGAELMFKAGVPFMQYDKSRHDVFSDDLTQFFKKYAPIMQRRPVSAEPGKLRMLIEGRKNSDNQEEL